MTDFLRWPPHDPQAVLPYSISWASWLESDEEVATSTWSVSPDDESLTLSSPSSNGTINTVWISGGTVGVTYVVTNHIITDSSPAKEDDRSAELKVKER